MNITDRIEYLAKNFDVFENDTNEVLAEKLKSLKDDSTTSVTPITNPSGKVLAYLTVKTNSKVRLLTNISVGMSVFSDMISADPTNNKVCLQWMLNVFSRLLKEGMVDAAIRFVDEDLPQANTYLTLFEKNKRKHKFINLCKGSFSLKHVKDPTDINQYKSLSQLFDAVDPFIEREPSAVERTMNKFVERGEAVIPVRDRKFTVFIPKTTEANVIFDNFASWCTAKANNGMFKSYTQNYKKPNGKNSDIYIVIDNKFFEGQSEDIYQLHFESRQVKDRKQSSDSKFVEKVLLESETLMDYFYEELMSMAKDKKTVDNNVYADQLVNFGFTDVLFELINDDAKTIKFMSRNMLKIPDVSRFKNVDQFIVAEANLTELHPSIGDMEQLELLSLPNNKLKTLPKEIGNLKNLTFINITGNRNISIPDEIKYLDRTNGGSLEVMMVSSDDIGELNFTRLKELLPEVSFLLN
jgi:hypothetical protein